jgi:hypothetical protein
MLKGNVLFHMEEAILSVSGLSPSLLASISVEHIVQLSPAFSAVR